MLRNIWKCRANQQALRTDIENFQPIPVPVANNIQDDQDVKEGDDIGLSATSPTPVEQKVQQQEVMLEQAFMHKRQTRSGLMKPLTSCTQV